VRDNTPWSKLELDRNTRTAKKQMRRWAKAGVDLHAAIPGYTGMNLGQRLYLYLQRGWPVQSCRRCRAPFILDGYATEFCGPVCSAEHRSLEKAIEVWSSDPAKAAALDLRVALYLRTDQPLRLCAECGKPYPLTDKRRITCSDVCRWRRHRSQKPKKCKHCGTMFEPKRTSGSPQKYCKPECREAAKAKRSVQNERRKLRRRPCRGCGEVFKPKRKWHVFHTRACKDRSKSKKKKGRWQTDRLCAACGEAYLPQYPQQKYHTAECKGTAKNARQREARRARSARKKAAGIT
jgi:hypothetical protein